MNYEDFLELVQKRRCIRRFKPDPIPDEYVDKIIDAARWAPSAFNSQPWEFVIAKGEWRDKVVQVLTEYFTARDKLLSKMEAVREPWQDTLTNSLSRGPGGMDYRTAPVFIILFGDTRTMKGLPMLLQYDNQRGQAHLTSSLAMAFIYMHMAATTLGLASRWVSAVNDPVTHCLLQELLGIPKEMEVYDMMAVGYPAVKPRPKLLRPKEKMVHYGYCGKDDFRTEEEVNDFIRRTRTWTIATMQRGPDLQV